ncbi:MAG: glycosyltransferase family 2 protein [Pseudomonadota bacterium]
MANRTGTGQRLDILLATFNGAAYLPEQLASIEAQTYSNWRVLIRDDGSTDQTVPILRDWVKRLGPRAHLLEDRDTGLGAAGNFARLLAASDAPYFSFCDQDDVWMPDKCERLFHALRKMESGCGADVPLLVHCDLEVVDQDLKPVAPSFRALEHRQPSVITVPQKLLIHNVVTGCALMGNAALRQAGLPMPGGIMMHDWWLALLARYAGQIGDVPEPLVMYRRHGKNVTGQGPSSVVAAFGRLLSGRDTLWRRMRSYVGQTQLQSAALADRLAALGQDQDIECAVAFAGLSRRNFLARRIFLSKNRMWTPSLLRNVGFLAAV